MKIKWTLPTTNIQRSFKITTIKTHWATLIQSILPVNVVFCYEWKWIYNLHPTQKYKQQNNNASKEWPTSIFSYTVE